VQKKPSQLLNHVAQIPRMCCKDLGNKVGGSELLGQEGETCFSLCRKFLFCAMLGEKRKKKLVNGSDKHRGWAITEITCVVCKYCC
jgi:hypothetical protein